MLDHASDSWPISHEGLVFEVIFISTKSLSFNDFSVPARFAIGFR